MKKIALTLILALLCTGCSVKITKQQNNPITVAAQYSSEASETTDEAETHKISPGFSKDNLIKQNLYRNFEAKTIEEHYKITSTLYLDQKKDLLRVEAPENTDLTIVGNLGRIEGEIQLVYEDSDGTSVTIATSAADGEEDISIDTTMNTKTGKGHFYFTGNSSIYTFELKFNRSDDIAYYLP